MRKTKNLNGQRGVCIHEQGWNGTEWLCLKWRSYCVNVYVCVYMYNRSSYLATLEWIPLSVLSINLIFNYLIACFIMYCKRLKNWSADSSLTILTDKLDVGRVLDQTSAGKTSHQTHPDASVCLFLDYRQVELNRWAGDQAHSRTVRIELWNRLQDVQIAGVVSGSAASLHATGYIQWCALPGSNASRFNH